jgi:hypothetical protein
MGEDPDPEPPRFRITVATDAIFSAHFGGGDAQNNEGGAAPTAPPQADFVKSQDGIDTSSVNSLSWSNSENQNRLFIPQDFAKDSDLFGPRTVYIDFDFLSCSFTTSSKATPSSSLNFSSIASSLALITDGSSLSAPIFVLISAANCSTRDKFSLSATNSLHRAGSPEKSVGGEIRG